MTARFWQLLIELYEATKNEGLKWQDTAEEGDFRIGLGAGIVRISYGWSEDTGEYYRAYLIDRKGRTIEEATVFDKQRAEFSMMENLYRLAKASAYNADQIIDSMIADLKLGKVRELHSDDY